MHPDLHRVLLGKVETLDDGRPHRLRLQRPPDLVQVRRIPELEVHDGPTREVDAVVEAELGAVDFSLGEEAATMSEVGTKLDLAKI